MPASTFSPSHSYVVENKEEARLCSLKSDAESATHVAAQKSIKPIHQIKTWQVATRWQCAWLWSNSIIFILAMSWSFSSVSFKSICEHRSKNDRNNRINDWLNIIRWPRIPLLRQPPASRLSAAVVPANISSTIHSRADFHYEYFGTVLVQDETCIPFDLAYILIFYLISKFSLIDLTWSLNFNCLIHQIV